jgi:hypothetical protein
MIQLLTSSPLNTSCDELNQKRKKDNKQNRYRPALKPRKRISLFQQRTDPNSKKTTHKSWIVSFSFDCFFTRRVRG